MITTGQEFLKFFQETAETVNKIFVPDDLDEALSKNIFIFMKDREDDVEEVLANCIIQYFRSSPGFVVTVKDFALKIESLHRIVTNEIEAIKKFESLVEKTKDRMDV